ncbi:hypothetical protein PAESOLCIP111_06733 [Paenibacillus solanacearum]|uniref:Extracellular solute-binding protein n=1 Tax=Paenibacillus solanacearum TaxID=2048548 RepID=A0A916KAY5_9BACL|nr:extracellular solute-binding protein [Paenibacillus solanacearum]CAG7653284.1 hypothetical protein PAESOLCIP111_06733 [Paenibacillus solanacearum]
MSRKAKGTMIRKFVIWGLLFPLISTVSACMGTKGGDEGGGKAAEGKKEPVELVFYSTSGDFDTDGFMTMFGNKIKEKYPYVTPKFIPYGKDTSPDKLLTAGEPLDIMYLSSGQTRYLLDYEIQYDISELIKKYKYDLSRMEPTTVEIQRMIANGGIYGLPVYNNTMTMFYNKDLFDRFGVMYPKDGLTWDELYELAKVMSRFDGAQQYQGITLSLAHTMPTNQFSIPYTDSHNKVNYTSGDFKKLFTAWTRFYQLTGNEVNKKTVSYTVQVNAFDKDKTIAMFLGLAALGPARFKEVLNWDVASFPVFQEKPEIGPQPYPTYFYITKTSKHKDVAFEVISYLTSDEFQLHLARNGLFPALKSRDAMKEYGQNIPFLKNKNMNGFLPKQFAPPAKPSTFQSVAHTPLHGAFDAVLLKEKDINTALREAEEKANKAVEAQLAGK